MIKAIIFDVGGTYAAGSITTFVNKSYKILNIDKTFSTNEQVIFDANLNKGLISHENCFKKYFNVPISDEQMAEIKKAWTTNWIPTEEMLELVKNLAKSYRLAILSNSDSLNSEKFEKQGCYKYFDPIILSHELAILKPDIKIYDITLEKLNLNANECLFIDDQEKVLVPARELGMDTILFKSLPQLKEELGLRGIKF